MKTLKQGMSGPAVTDLQEQLEALGDSLTVDGDFGPETKAAITSFQTAHGLDIDGEVGPLTQAALDLATKNKQPAKPSPVVPPSDTPWMKFMLDRLGWTEFDHDKELSQYWKLSGLNYTTIIGSDHAWCMMIGNAALVNTGFKGTGEADAASGARLGISSDYKYGAAIPIRHASGAHHFTFFHHWVDESKKLAACLGGNQGNLICIEVFNLSGNSQGHDECVSGPRWPVKA